MKESRESGDSARKLKALSARVSAFLGFKARRIVKGALRVRP
jgi:hypothetical protein